MISIWRQHVACKNPCWKVKVTVEAWSFSVNRIPLAILMKFDNCNVCRDTRLQSSFNLLTLDYSTVPYITNGSKFSPSGGKAAMTRKQFPLRLCWVSSVHRVQGASVDHIAVLFEKALTARMLYVAFGRSRTLNDVYITGFDDKNQNWSKSSVWNELSVAGSFLPKPFEILNLARCILNAHSVRLTSKVTQSFSMLKSCASQILITWPVRLTINLPLSCHMILWQTAVDKLCPQNQMCLIVTMWQPHIEAISIGVQIVWAIFIKLLRSSGRR